MAFSVYAWYPPVVGARSHLPAPAACASALRWPGPWPRVKTRTIIAHSHAQLVPRARVAPAPRTRATQLRWARPRQASSLGARAHAASQPSGRTPTIDIARLIVRTHPPAFLRRRQPETSRHRASRSCFAFCSSHYHSSSPCRRRSTNMRSTPFSSRCILRFNWRCDLRPSPALFAQPSREINTTAPDPHTPLRTHTKRTQHNGRAEAHYNAGKTIHPSIYFVTNIFRAQGYQPTIHRCASPAGRHACDAASVGPAAARARPVRMLHARAL